MKKFFTSLLLFTISICGFAQVSAKVDTSVIYLDIPQKMNIKDKIILQNKSPYTILQAVVVMADTGEPLGTACYLGPGRDVTVANYEDNELKQLRGTRIALKAKGVKKHLGDISSTSVDGGSPATGGIGIDVNHSEIKADELNNIDPSLITYDFHASLFEQDHDLYISITLGTAKNALDF